MTWQSSKRLVVLLFFGLGLGVAAGAHQESKQKESERPPAHAGVPDQDARKIKNPIASDSASIAEGKKIYGRYCASCHGPTGKGDGAMALSGGTPSNLTDETWDHGSTDGEIFVVVRDGLSSDMESYKDRLTEKQIWQVINYIRSIGPTPQKEGRIADPARSARPGPPREPARVFAGT
jgi:mono/diheme cytochrome c family protein